MRLNLPFHIGFPAVKLLGRRRFTSGRLAIGAASAAFALITVGAVAPPPPLNSAQLLKAYDSAHAQTLTVSNTVAVDFVKRSHYSATPGIEALAISGTNYDWAKLVLLSGGWPMTDSNVTVILRWMRQENGANDWWNRDNPLNNSFGAPGAGGTGTYASLVNAAQKAAQALQKGVGGGYGGIVAALAVSAPDTTVEQAIWASSWSTSHYANGTHWSHAPVPIVKAPDSAW
jgi:hypothetical protein